MVRRASGLVLRGSLRSRIVVTADIRSSNEGAWPGVEKGYWYGVVIVCSAGEYTGLMTLELIACRKQVQALLYWNPLVRQNCKRRNDFLCTNMQPEYTEWLVVSAEPAPLSLAGTAITAMSSACVSC